MKQLILVLLLAFGFNFIQAQSFGTSSYVSSPRLYIQNKEQKDDFLRIWYKVNYPGYVELHLIKSEWNREAGTLEDRVLLIRGKVTDKREEDQTDYLGYISFPIGPLEEGESYRYELHYKGKKYSGRI
ncbi:MAG: hypothetical protein AAF804_08455 [Bacteroidota bacterium]